ncbi:bestrophin family protein [Amaricoccus tamworthensis]|uniref:bestrophin family protein n=1 Tax=Amaricoccus tamworthensis TaxID=57002 RepID=UPI003C7B1332
MIVREYPNVLRLFLVLQGSVIPRIYKHILFLVGLTVVIMLADRYLFEMPHTTMQPFLALGVALSLFLGFRNVAAYDRWWQGRMQWGQLTGCIRAMGHDSRIYLNDEDRKEILCLTGAFIHLHRAGLRKDSKAAQPALQYVDDETLDRFQHSNNPASAALQEIGTRLADYAREGRLSGYGQLTFTQRMSDLELSRTSNEGISNTPMPFVYSLLVWQTALLYCMLLPMGLLDSAGILAPAFEGIAGYVFFGLAAVTDELEHPFSASKNGLPLDALCRSVDISLAEQLGRTPPPPLEVRYHILT